ncbi:hypothetical protein BER2_0809 [plant metagenome]|uniref:Uncharacterized protein n=1 Tax=plant metagenome TaxID=1297885 RepID=A0A484QNI4_9ZZZZ
MPRSHYVRLAATCPGQPIGIHSTHPFRPGFRPCVMTRDGVRWAEVVRKAALASATAGHLAPSRVECVAVVAKSD